MGQTPLAVWRLWRCGAAARGALAAGLGTVAARRAAAIGRIGQGRAAFEAVFEALDDTFCLQAIGALLAKP